MVAGNLRIVVLKENNIIREKSYTFALRIIKAHKYLVENHEYVVSKQLLRSGTSIGANVEEAIGGQSRRDFLSKLSIAYKEARETHYWIRLLKDSDILSAKAADSLLRDCDGLLKLLSAIQKTVKTSNS